MVSLSRIAVSPTFAFLFVSEDKIFVLSGMMIFIYGAISDWFDGWYARKYNEVSKWGNFIDPLADKFLTTAGFIAFNSLDIMPAWMIVLIVIRDFGTTFLRLFGDSHQIGVKTKYSAKVKTFLQLFGIISIMVFYTAGRLSFDPEISEFCMAAVHSDTVYYFLFFLTGFTLWTLYEYIRDNMNIVKKLFGYES